MSQNQCASHKTVVCDEKLIKNDHFRMCLFTNAFPLQRGRENESHFHTHLSQYFSVSGMLNKNNETNIFVESDIIDQLKIVTQRLEVTQLVIGFMLDSEKRDLLN